MSLIHLARQGFITKSALPNVTRQRGTTTGTANLMLYGAGKTHSIGTNTTFTDSSSNNFTVTRNGDTIQATNNPFTGSVYFDGNGDYLSFSTFSGFDLGAGDFTIEFWINPTTPASNSCIIDTRAAGGTAGYFVSINSSRQIIFNYFTNYNGAIVLTENVWSHVALVRVGSTIRMYINGVAESGTFSSSANITAFAANIGQKTYTISNLINFNGNLSNVRIVKGTAVYTSNFTVPTSPLTAITNTQLLLLTAQQAPFRDSSSNNFTVTANGNAAGSGLEPFPVNYAGSGYFDGTGDYLSVANSTNLDLPADFTVEAWIYLTSTANNQNTIIGKWDTNSYAWLLNANPSTGALGFSIGNSGAYVTGINFGTSITANTWHHVAVIRTGSTIRAFVNGTQVGSDQTNTSNLTATATTFIGKDDSALRNFNGYISNVRVIKGTAQYTAAFTPPSAPLTAVTNTQLLLLTNNVGPFVDTSANGFPVLRNGDAVQTGFSPFTGQPSAGSAYFDGTGDRLSIAANAAFSFGTGDLTVEYWIYANSFANGPTVFDTRSSSGSASGYADYFGSNGSFNLYIGNATIYTSATNVAVNTWTHIAVTRSGTSLRVFINGVQSGSTVTNSTNFTDNLCLIGVNVNLVSYLNGYISNLRVTKGAALYTSNFTPATAPLPAVPNTSLLLNTDNYTIANSTSTYLPVTVNGNTTISTAQYPTGMNRSIYFDGSGDTLVLPNNASLSLGSSDFTIESYVYLTKTGVATFCSINADTGAWAGVRLDLNQPSTNDVNLLMTTNGVFWSVNFSVLGVFATNVWRHIAIVRSGDFVTLYINGSRAAGQSISGSLYGGTINKIGAVDFSGDPAFFPFQGYMSNFRIVKGSALYTTTTFTPPSLPLQISVSVPNFVTNSTYGVYQLA